MSIGMPEIILIFVVILLVFGPKRIPEIARAFGKASDEFKKAKDTINKELTEESDNVPVLTENNETNADTTTDSNNNTDVNN